MRRRILFLSLILFASGCSNAPLAGALDCVAPARGNRADGNRGPVVPEIRPPNNSTDGLPPPAEIAPRP